MRATQVKDDGVEPFMNEVYNFMNTPQISRIKRTATSYTATKDDRYIGVTSTAAARTINLPALNSMRNGADFIIKDESGGAGTNNITIDGYGAETIDGALTKVINTNFGSVTLMKSGTAWFTI